MNQEQLDNYGELLKTLLIKTDLLNVYFTSGVIKKI